MSCKFLFSQFLWPKIMSNRLLMVLSLNDLLHGILIWPLVTIRCVVTYRVEPNCITLDLLYFLAYHLGSLTMCSIFLVALEQYIAIVHPYFYLANVTFNRLVVPMLLYNSVFIAINIPLAVWYMRIWMVYTRFLFLPIMVMIVLALVYMHTKIIRCAANITAKITNTNKEEGKQIKSRAKAAKSGLIVLIATLVCYSPIICYNIYAQLTEPTPFVRTFVQTASEIISLFSSVVDPVVYYWRLKSLRKATKHMFHSICRKKHTRVHSGSGIDDSTIPDIQSTCWTFENNWWWVRHNSLLSRWTLYFLITL